MASQPLPPSAEPAEVGFDADRLRRLHDHLARYVTDGKLAGWQLLLTRRGRTVLAASCGHRDAAAGLPMTGDTLFRIYSMTKPITAVAAMMLYEEGAFDLTDPVAAFLPAYRHPQVYVGGPPEAPVTRPATEPIRLWHLFTHTAGLTYGSNRTHPVDAMYRAAGFELDPPPDLDLAACTDAWAGFPLLFDPGSAWNYSVATDVLGRIVEVVSGLPLDAFLQQRIFDPLGMSDTGFSVPAADRHRLARLYVPSAATGLAVPDDEVGDRVLGGRACLSGGAGLVCTLADYARFAGMLLGRGALDGVRILGTRTVDYLSRNHLPGGVDIATFGGSFVADSRFGGVGHGLGIAVMDNPMAYRTLCSTGEIAWGGAASTAFWVDPNEQITGIFLAQLMPSGTYPLRTQLRQLAYSALID